MINQIWALIKKDILLDWRQQFNLAAVVLFMASIIFIIVYATQSKTVGLWNAMLWVILLFVAHNSVAKNFQQSSDRQRIYLYSIVHPIAALLAKYIYNAVVLLILFFIAYLGFSVFSGLNPVKELGLFCLVLLLGAFGFSIILTFTSSIAAAANDRSTLLAILSFPIILPILMLLLKLSQHCVGLIPDSSYMTDILMLVAIDLLLVGLSLILYPYLWKG